MMIVWYVKKKIFFPGLSALVLNLPGPFTLTPLQSIVRQIFSFVLAKTITIVIIHKDLQS